MITAAGKELRRFAQIPVALVNQQLDGWRPAMTATIDGRCMRQLDGANRLHAAVSHGGSRNLPPGASFLKTRVATASTSVAGNVSQQEVQNADVATRPAMLTGTA